MDNLLAQALNNLKKGTPCAFATIVESTSKGTPQKTGAKMVVLPDGSIFGTIGGGPTEEKAKKDCLKAIKSKKPSLLSYNYHKKKVLCGGEIKVFIEPILTKKDLIICGAGHIGLALSIVGKLLNFNIIIVDNRKTFANKKRFPHADKILPGNLTQSLKKLSITKNSLIMIATQDHASDFECLKAVVKSNSAYIGVIASRSKSKAFTKKLKSLKIQNQFIKKIKMPAGLDIGSQTPQEISISIIAQIIQKMNSDFLGSEKFKKQ